MKNVLILGASDDPSRYSYKAMKSLLGHGHQVILVSPKYDEIEGHKCYRHISEASERIDVLTMYVGAKISSNLMKDIVKVNPKIVIFNPGSENPELYQVLEQNKIEYIEACTLVLLNADRFEGICA